MTIYSEFKKMKHLTYSYLLGDGEASRKGAERGGDRILSRLHTVSLMSAQSPTWGSI